MEYNRNFQDNISAQDFNNRSTGTANWIEENRETQDFAKDPNAYEMTNIFLFAGKHLSEGQDIDLDGVNRIWAARSQDFKNCGVSENSFVYLICKESYEAAISGQSLVNDEGSHSAIRDMAGIGLSLYQYNRDNGGIDFNNLGQLTNLLENSRELKQRHPDLHEQFGFDKNLQALYDMQDRHLDEKGKEILDKAFDNYKNGPQKEQQESYISVDEEERR